MGIRSVFYRLKDYLNLSTLLIILLLIFIPNIVKAETISYTTPLEGCNVATKIRPSCTPAAAAAMASDPRITVLSCSPDTVTTGQSLPCNMLFTNPPYQPNYYTYNMWANAHYSCIYGGANYIGVTASTSPFICSINITQYQIKDTTTNATRTWNTSYVYHPSISGAILQKIGNGPRTDVTDVTTIDYYAPDATCTGGYLGCRGQITSITNALGHVTQITRYSAHGQPEEIIDPNGLITTLTYDACQRLLSRTSGTEDTYYQYDGVGQIKKITFPDNSFLSFTYDNAHRLTGIADNLGNRLQYTLDAIGNRTQEKRYDPANTLTQSQQREFDALSRLWKDIGTQSQTTQYSYDAQGNLKQITDPLLNTVSHQFDALNRLTQTIDPVGNHIQQNLDALDQVTKVTDPRSIDTTYTYNVFGDLIQESSADRGITTYTYDEAGNLKTLTDARGVTHTYTWDALNRPTNRAHTTVTGVPGTDTVIWSYDAGTNGIGRLTGMSDESGSTSFSYDLHGRLLNKTQTAKFGTVNYILALSHQYDSNGRLNQMTYPSGTQVSTAYGLDGRPTEIRVNGNVLISNIAYQPFGEPKGWIWGNGQTYTRSFDLDGRLTQHPVGSDTRTLSYDAASRITSTTDTNPIYNRGYDYDALNRLVGQTDNTSFKLWPYDSNSNRTVAQIGGTSYPYTPATNSNRLLDVVGPVAKTYSYDAAGNPFTDGATNFSWNAASSLFSTTVNSMSHFYKYNGLGQRITKNGPLSEQYFFLYDPAGQLIGEYQDDIATTQPDDWLVIQETIWLEDIPVAVIKRPVATEPIQIYYIHTDHLNTPRLIVNQNNTAVWRWENTHAFGANLPDEDPDSDSQSFEYNLRFPGQYFDKETSLHYNYFRYYEPEIGRYISPDPIGLAGGLNTYGYVEQNPLRFVDPTGEIAWAPLLIGASVGALAGATIDLASQLLSNGGNLQCVDKSNIALSAGMGSIPAGVVGAIGSKVLGQFLTKGVTNPVPGTLARVVPGNVNPKNLSTGVDAFVTDAKALQGLNAKQIADKLTIPQSSSGFRVIEFPTPSSGIASPILRNHPGFVGRGRTAGGASEFVLSNGPIPAGATTRIVQ